MDYTLVRGLTNNSLSFATLDHGTMVRDNNSHVLLHTFHLNHKHRDLYPYYTYTNMQETYSLALVYK